jgi:hypothetical protein
MHDPIREEHRIAMQNFAKVMDEFFNPSGESKVGFALLCFDFGTGGYMNYISNAGRPEMLIAMKEFIARNQFPETKSEAKQ